MLIISVYVVRFRIRRRFVDVYFDCARIDLFKGQSFPSSKEHILDIGEWLEELGLGKYAAAFEECEVSFDDLSSLDKDDLKEDLGVSSLPDRKKLLAAIAALNEGASETAGSAPPPTTSAVFASSPLSRLIDSLPHVIAMPLHEYAEEDHPGMKLWAACDAVELLLRFLVTVGVADRHRHGELDDKLLKQLWGKIEMPTLGAWMAMARSLAEAKGKGALIAPEIDDFVMEPLSELLYGPENPGTADTSFLALRNRLAHGGGLTRKEAERLLGIWQAPFEKMVEALAWLSGVRVIGLDDAVPMELRGTSDKLKRADDLDASRFEGDRDGVWLIRGEDTVPLWPLALFGHPSTSTSKGNISTGDENAAQIYVRKDVVRLQFTPLGADGFSQSEAGETALEAFQSLFSLDRAKQQDAEKKFKVQDFLREIQRDASQMVGRHEEQEHIESSFKDLEQGIVWLTGPAGIGKSFLVARMAQDLIEKNEDPNTIILPYRFKSGDDTRCNRDALANFSIERLVAKGALMENVTVEEKGKAEDRLKSCLDYLSRDKKVIFILDGLDELLSRDKTFAEEVPLSLRYPRVTWVCAGRPEPSLQEAFRINEAIMPYPDGLPPMRIQDIRGMLLDKIGPLRKKLLQNDKEKGEGVVNPFIDLVAKRADGLPLYVKYVIGDVLSNRYRVLDGNEDLPDSLHAYHEQLIDNLGIGDLKAILTPLAATLAVALEPLAEHEIVTFLQLRNLIPNDDTGEELVTKGLAAMAPMLRRAPDPEGEEGFTLFHASLRAHILTAPSMAGNVTTSRKAFAEAALTPDQHQNISNYLYRTGVDHLLDIDKKDEARKKLLDLNCLGKMFELGKEKLEILKYWQRINPDFIGSNYIGAVERLLNNHQALKVEESLGNLLSFFEVCGWYETGSIIAAKIIGDSTRINQMTSGQAFKICKSASGLMRQCGYFDQAESAIRFWLCREDAESTEVSDQKLSARSVLASINKARGKYQESADEFFEIVELRKGAQGDTDHKTLSALSNYAGALLSLGHLDQAIDIFSFVANAREEAHGPESVKTATSKAHLASAMLSIGNIEGAEKLYEGLLIQFSDLYGENHPYVLTMLNNLATLYGDTNRHHDATKALEKAVKISKRVLGASNKSSLTYVNNLVASYYRIEDYKRAEELCQETCLELEGLLGFDHPTTLSSYNNLAQIQEKTGDAEKAGELLQRVLNARQQKLGKEHPDTLTSLLNLGSFLTDYGSNYDCVQLCIDAFRGRLSIFGRHHSKTHVTAVQLIISLIKRVDYRDAHPETAKSLVYEVLDALGEAKKLNDLRCADIVQKCGVALRELNELEAATKVFSDLCIALRKISSDKKSIQLSSALTALGTTLGACAQYDKAVEHLTESASIRRQLVSDGDAKMKSPLSNTLIRLADVYGKMGKADEAEAARAEIATLSADEGS